MEQIAAPDSPRLPEQRFECEHCGKIFPSSTRYHKHVKLHSALRLFRCTFPGCGKSFKRKPHLTRHVATHQEDKPYQCSHPGCGKSFTSNQKLRKHLKSHRQLSCKICGQSFRKKVMLEQHQWTHNTATSMLRCPVCDEAVEKSALPRHMKRHKSHQCDQCEEKFLHFHDLVKHRREHHPSKTHLCPDCGKGFKRESALREHQLHVHSEQLLLCPRPDCGQTFTSASNLYQHERVVHLGLRPFTCRECGDTFAYKHVLRRHRMVMHPAIPLKNGSTQNSQHGSEDSQPRSSQADKSRILPPVSLVQAFSKNACLCREESCPHSALSASAEPLPEAASTPATLAEAVDVMPRPAKRPRRLALMSRCGPESEATVSPLHVWASRETERRRDICTY